MAEMKRRNFLAGAAVPLFPALAAEAAPPPKPGRVRVTGVRLVPLRTIRQAGSMEPAWALGTRMNFAVGGGAYLEILTDQGPIGIGHPPSAAAIPTIREYLTGKDPFDAEVHFPALSKATSYRDAACVEMACWDLVGKCCGQPLYKLWGGGKDKVRAYASMVALSTPEERAEMAVRLQQEGWKGFKLRFHFPTMKEDLRVFEAVRKAAGSDLDLMVDANQSFPVKMGIEWDFNRALETARALQSMKCYWLEEPLKRDDYDGQAKLCSMVEVAISGGEVHHDLSIFATLIRNKVFDVLNPEGAELGIAGLRKVTAAAAVFGMPVVPHNGLLRIGTIAHLHAIAASPNADYVELIHDPPIGSYLHNFAVFQNPPLVDKDGFLPVPQGPGLGVEINPDMIAR